MIWNQQDFRQSRLREVQQQVFALAKQQSAEVDRIAEGALQFLVALAQIPEIADGRPDCGDLLARIRTNYRSYSALIRADLSGIVTCSSIGPGPSIADRLYFKRAIETNRFSIGEYVHGRGTNAPSIHFSYPIRNEQGQVKGVVAAALDLPWFALRLSEKLPQDTSLGVADANGTMLVRIPENEKFSGQVIPEHLRRFVQAPYAGVEQQVIGLDGKMRILGYVPLRASAAGLFVGAARETDSAFADIQRAEFRGYLLVGLGLFLSLALAALWGEYGIRRPVGALLQSARRWHEGDYTPSVRGWGRSEFGQIGNAFDELVRAVSEREAQLRTSDRKLGASQQYLTTVLEQVAGIVQTLPDKTYGFVNRGFCELLGRSPEQLVGRKFTEFTHPDDVAGDSERFESALRERQPYTHRKRYVRPDGTTVWTENTVTHLEPYEGILAVSVDLTERLQSESMQKRLMDELSHRVKNTLATVQALIAISSRYTENAEDLVQNLIGRINALTATHDLLTATNWEQAKLADLIRAELTPYTSEREAKLDGPEVHLTPQEAVSLGLVIHELATNAVKYGSLAVNGSISVTWTVTDDETKILALRWQEFGAENVHAPIRLGFGSVLIVQSVTYLRGSVTKEFRSDGLVCDISIPLRTKASSEANGRD